MLYGYGLAVGRVEGLVHVVYELGVGVVKRVQLQDDVLVQPGCRGRYASGGGQVGAHLAALLLDVAHLEYGPVHLSVEAVAQLLRHVAQLQVVVGNLAQVDVLAEVGVGGVGGAVLDGLRVGQVSVGRLAGGSAGEDAHLERPAGLVLGHGYLCQFLGNCLGHAGGRKSAQGQVLVVLD